MERLDAVACRDIAAQIRARRSLPPTITTCIKSFRFLRQCSYMVSSRYHGIVTACRASSLLAGVTMDERIRNLMRERGHQHLFLTVDDPEPRAQTSSIMETLVAEADSVRDGIARTVVGNLKVMARMGTILEERSATPVPRVSSAERRAQLGRISAAVGRDFVATRRTLRSAERCNWLKIVSRKFGSAVSAPRHSGVQAIVSVRRVATKSRPTAADILPNCARRSAEETLGTGVALRLPKSFPCAP